MSVVVRGKCSICTNQFMSDNISALPCGHTYHFQCITAWVKTGHNCPICRTRCQERQVIKHLFFDAPTDDSILEDGGSTVGNEELLAKIEDVTIRLKQAEESSLSSKAEVVVLKKEKEVLEAKLAKEKKRYTEKIPHLEGQIRQLNMLLEDQEGLKEEMERCKRRLQTTEFVRNLTVGTDYEAAIDKFVNKKGDPDTGNMLSMLRRQLDEARKAAKKADDVKKAVEEKVSKLEEDKRGFKKMVQALKEECNELRVQRGGETSGVKNEKLQKVLDMSPPKRDSLGFDSTTEFNDTLINSALRPTLSRPPLRVVAEPRNKNSWLESHTSQPSTSSEKTKSNALIFQDDADDSFFDDITLPPALLKRVQHGSPKKGGNGTGGYARPAQRALDRLEHASTVPSPVLAPRVVRKVGGPKKAEPVRARAVVKRKSDSIEVVGTSKNTRLSQFFAKSKRSEEDEVVALD